MVIWGYDSSCGAQLISQLATLVAQLVAPLGRTCHSLEAGTSFGARRQESPIGSDDVVLSHADVTCDLDEDIDAPILRKQNSAKV